MCLAVIAVASLLIYVCYLSLSVSLKTVSYNFYHKLDLRNPTAFNVVNSDWYIKSPLVNSSSENQWKSLAMAAVPPFGQDQYSVHISGTQIYPQFADQLLSNMHVNKADIIEDLMIKGGRDIGALLDWVHLQLEYTGFQKSPIDIEQLLESKKGDCTEFTLFTYYVLKSKGFLDVVPVEGYHLANTGSQLVGGSNFHAWLLVKNKGRWLIVDPLYKVIAPPSSEYIVTNIMQEGKALPFIKNTKLSVRLN